jgi:pimeloyl-ACP methyl ester carboxylesterase
VNPIAFDDIPADDIKTLQRNTGRFAIRISHGVLGAAPLMRDLLQHSVADEANMPDPLLARYLAPYVCSQGLNHLLALSRSVSDEDMADVELRQLDRPTLIVWGDQDAFVSAKIGEQLAETIPGSRLVRLPGMGRLVPEEAPETLANMILEFVGAAGMVRTE